MRTRNVFIALALAGALVLTACGGSDDSDSKKLRIGFIAGSAASLPDMIAKERGLFEDAGIEVQFVNTDSGPGLVNLVLSGSVDVSWAPTSNVLAATEKTQIVAGNVRSYGFELVRRTGFGDSSAELDYPESLAALADGRVGVSATASYAEVLAKSMFEDAGVKASAVKFLAVGVGPTSQGALKSGQIDMVIANPVTAAQLQVAGAGDPVVSTLDIATLKNLPEAAYVTRRNASPELEEKVAKYLGVINEAITWAQDEANVEDFDKVLAKVYALDEDDAQAVAERYNPGEGGLINEYGLDFDESGFQNLVDLLLEGKLLKQKVEYADATSLIDPA